MLRTASYSEFSSGLHERKSGRRAPADVSIELTHRCPLDCQHCYNNLPMNDRKAREQELSFEEHVRLLDELASMGCLWILYTGGEVFARKDFLDIYAEAKKRGFLITIFTNGTMITPRVADYLAEYPPFSIEITLYGATRETYETLTRIPGSYDLCIRGIRLLLERKLPLKLKTVPTIINYHEVGEMKRMAEEDFGVEFKFDPLVNPRIDCSQSPLAVRLTPEQAVELDFSDARRRAEYKILAENELMSPAPEPSPMRYHCGGGQNGCAVDPTGRMNVCVLSHKNSYEMRSGGFREGWEGPLREIRATPRTRDTICTNCRIQSLCSMCAANGELENGDAESPVEFLCQVAHLRAYALGIEVPAHDDCPCCAGGVHEESLRSAAVRINRRQTQRQKESSELIPLQPSVPPLPVLQPRSGCGSGSGGCSSCGTHLR